MNPKAFEAALNALAGVLDGVEARLAAGRLVRIASIFGESREKTTAASLKKLDDMSVSSQSGTGELPKLIALLRSAKSFADRISGKAFATQLDALITALNRNASASVDAFADAAIAKLTAPKTSGKPPPREDVVSRYVRWLEDCLGDEGFAAPYKQLDQDKTVTPAERVEIGKRFTGEKPASGPKALQAIWARHNAMLTVRSKSDSRAGRSAG